MTKPVENNAGADGGPDLVPAMVDNDQESFTRALEQAGFPAGAANKVSEIILSVSETESTTGHFPPPRMLERYKAIDPRIVDVLIDEYSTQPQHRREMEAIATKGSLKISGLSNIFSNIIALSGLFLSGALIAFFEFKNIDYSLWAILAIMLISVGGKPVAYLISEFLSASRGSSKD